MAPGGLLGVSGCHLGWVPPGGHLKALRLSPPSVLQESSRWLGLGVEGLQDSSSRTGPFLQDSPARIPPPKNSSSKSSSSRIPPPGFFHDEFSSRVPPPRFLLQDFISQDFLRELCSRIPPLGLPIQDCNSSSLFGLLQDSSSRLTIMFPVWVRLLGSYVYMPQ